ncbi:DAPG hydrolase family protein [Nocardia callitridis]|uniref:DAPG hydrolase PhiG domain-containing protein n=1 Tax=Nocardia callitridis TaxID=648753 RepID=A0ABP9L342_9NOCA
MPTVTRRTSLQLAAAAALGLTFAGAARAHAQDPNVRYLGYTEDDQKLPYAKYFVSHTAPVPQRITDALAGPIAPERIPSLSRLPEDLAEPGYSEIECGYGQSADGVLWVAALTPMPGVTAVMWDWWFGWHSTESARYKLWHPDAHSFAALAEDRTAWPVSDREKYIDNTTFVDEYIGDRMEQLAITFRDPASGAIAVPEGSTVIYGRVGSSVAPVDLGWLAHQVRPTADGAEMRSRFYLNVPGLHPLDPVHTEQALRRGSTELLRNAILDLDFARDLLAHCGAEMNHLAGFLPDLWAEFGR